MKGRGGEREGERTEKKRGKVNRSKFTHFGLSVTVKKDISSSQISVNELL